MKEWEYLRTDIRLQIEQSKYLEFATVVALGTFYAWYLSVAARPPRFVLLVPTLLVALAALRSYATLLYIQRSAKYVRTLEAALSLGAHGLVGWDRTRDLHDSKTPALKLSAALFWCVATGITIAAWWFV